MNRKKSPNETMLNYMRDIQRLIGKLNVHVSQREQYTCNTFLNGLPTKILMQMGPMQDKPQLKTSARTPLMCSCADVCSNTCSV